MDLIYVLNAISMKKTYALASKQSITEGYFIGLENIK